MSHWSGQTIRKRDFLGGLAATALGMMAGQGGLGCPACAQGAAPSKPHRIDMHHHFSPPQWIAAVKGREMLQRANTEWTPARSIEDMDQAGVAAAIVSVTNPGLWFGDKDVTHRIARECNDYGARLMADHSGRFGLFAAMPMPDVDATLKEIEYAFDTLKADGAHLFTSYGDTWIGNSAYEPVMAELNRRKAVVHVHPTAANCCRNLVPDVPPNIMEYGTDTTRAILSVIFSGTAVRFPDIRFIWSHAGGTAPILAGRIEQNVRNLKEREQRLPNGAMHELKRFHYDVAGAANAGALTSLLQMVTSAQVLFGTDFPPARPEHQHGEKPCWARLQRGRSAGNRSGQCRAAAASAGLVVTRPEPWSPGRAERQSKSGDLGPDRLWLQNPIKFVAEQTL